jgi:hypothetical protein
VNESAFKLWQIIAHERRLEGREDLGNLFGRKLLRFSVQTHGHVERIEGSYTCNIASAQTCV